MIRGIIAFVAGVIALQWQSELPHPSWLLLIPGAAALSLKAR